MDRDSQCDSRGKADVGMACAPCDLVMEPAGPNNQNDMDADDTGAMPDE